MFLAATTLFFSACLTPVALPMAHISTPDDSTTAAPAGTGWTGQDPAGSNQDPARNRNPDPFQHVPGEERLVADFDSTGSDPSTAGLSWQSVNDTVMGGRSEGAFAIDRGRLRFSGKLNTNGGGFASIRSEPRAMQLGGFAGLHLRVRGDGREYSVRLTQSGDRGWRRASYRNTFSTAQFSTAQPSSADARGDADREAPWQDVYLLFEDFVPTWRGSVLDRPPVTPERIESVGITLADGKDGPFALEVDSIRAFRPFDLADYVADDDLSDGYRVLVLFAPDAVDLDLLRQHADLRRHVEGCVERSMRIVVVLEDGPSAAGDRPLSAMDVRALRRRFGIGKGSYRAVLVGKDGGVKHEASSFVPATAWFERIDAMPMRQREMRESGAPASR